MGKMSLHVGRLGHCLFSAECIVSSGIQVARPSIQTLFVCAGLVGRNDS
jgi:hypothetical protein